MLDSETFFRALADPTRFRSLLLLQHEGELCVCELTHALDVSQPKISRHLALLREAGVVIDRRQGLWVFYRLHPELPEWMAETLRVSARHQQDSEPFSSDRKRLRGMQNRPTATRCA